MLPLDNRPWAPQLAKAVIVVTVVAEVLATLWLRRYGPLDTAEKVTLFLVLLAVIPPNIHIIRRRPGEGREEMTGMPLSKPNLPR